MTDKSGVLYEGGCSAVGYKPIVGHVVPDRMGEIVAGGTGVWGIPKHLSLRLSLEAVRVSSKR